MCFDNLYISLPDYTVIYHDILNGICVIDSVQLLLIFAVIITLC